MRLRQSSNTESLEGNRPSLSIFGYSFPNLIADIPRQINGRKDDLVGFGGSDQWCAGKRCACTGERPWCCGARLQTVFYFVYVCIHEFCISKLLLDVKANQSGGSILHKLDQISDMERRKMEDKQRELLHPKTTTVLQQRRQANVTKEKRNIEMVTKPKAITGLVYSLILNMILVFALCITMPNETSTFLRLIHGSVCLSALIVSRVFSSIWFSDIANASLKYTGVQTPSLSLSRMTGDFCSSILLDSIFFAITIRQ
ncbi:BMA-EPG-4, isoform a [Dirofilaria immitis]|nr:BMA-EPG-4, isoform a [Dirofilaria immitis]